MSQITPPKAESSVGLKPVQIDGPTTLSDGEYGIVNSVADVQIPKPSEASSIGIQNQTSSRVRLTFDGTGQINGRSAPVFDLALAQQDTAKLISDGTSYYMEQFGGSEVKAVDAVIYDNDASAWTGTECNSSSSYDNEYSFDLNSNYLRVYSNKDYQYEAEVHTSQTWNFDNIDQVLWDYYLSTTGSATGTHAARLIIGGTTACDGTIAAKYDDGYGSGDRSTVSIDTSSVTGEQSVRFNVAQDSYQDINDVDARTYSIIAGEQLATGEIL